MAHIPPKELLEATHTFPGIYVFKVIGSASGPFEAYVARELSQLLQPPSRHSRRLSADGKHVALTLEIHVQNVDQVIEIYQKLIIAPDLALVL